MSASCHSFRVRCADAANPLSVRSPTSSCLHSSTKLHCVFVMCVVGRHREMKAGLQDNSSRLALCRKPFRPAVKSGQAVVSRGDKLFCILIALHMVSKKSNS